MSAAEKFELLDIVWESLESEPPVLTDEQLSELEDRVASYRRNPQDVVSWEQVKSGLLKKH
jgi:putative addiction module component (TIGR02574 family)